MKYLKNTQIANEYEVFRGSVGKWVQAAINKENNLQVEMIDEKWKIIDNAHNRAELLNLKEKGLKYRKKSAFEKVTVNPEIYNIFSETNLTELITKIEEDKFIPLKFSYLERGADFWNELVETMYSNKDSYYISDGDRLLNLSLEYIIQALSKYDVINIVDVGPGTGYSIKSLIEKLIEEGFKINYSAIDISQRMLDIVSQNLHSWHPDIEVETEIGDMDYVVIRDLLFNNKISNDNSCNLILFLGCTIGNVYDRNRVFSNFSDSMGKNDYFVIDNRLDIVKERSKFKTLENKYMLTQINWIPDMLGLQKNMYEIINKYDDKTESRLQVLKINKNIDLDFKLKNGNKSVRLLDGDEITIWNHYSHTFDCFIKEVRDVGLNVSYLSKTSNKTQALLICEKE